MKVVLLSWTRSPELICARAMRGCRSISPSSDIRLRDFDITRLLRKAIKYGHESVLEHASFIFSISGVSRVLTHQLVRHRLASYSQQSLRAVSPTRVVCPPSILDNLEAQKEWSREIGHLFYLYDRMLDKFNIKKEDARYLLPMGIATNITVTMNARELRHFFRLRCNPPAQWEMRILARKMLEEVRKVAPFMFEDIIGGK